jgi:dTDP-glucose 4,6-dehydratase
MAGRALVAGGAGFLGSHICDRLLADGWSVVCVDNFVTGDIENVGHLRDRADFELLEADITGDLTLPGPYAAVLNFASPASPVDYLDLPIETMKVGSIGTLNLLEVARTNGARFLLASTSEVYGDPLVHPQPESYWGNVNPVGPRAVYDEAKRFSEALTTAYRGHYGVDTAIIRIFNTYGPRMRPGDGRAIPNFISQALTGEPLTVAGDGLQTRSVCYVDDLVDGIVRLLNSRHVGPVNVGNPHEISMLDLANTIRELTRSASSVRYVARPVDDPTVRRPDISLARELLEWSPGVQREEGLLRTIEWFRTRLDLADPGHQ